LTRSLDANATGVYSGINANGNGNTADTSNIRSTAGRGLQLTDNLGVAQFTTNFPGWYTGRAVHIHVLAHIGSTVLGTGRYTGGTNSHVGQLFFDQTLITDVSKVTPYSSNKQTLTTNVNDGIFKQQAATSDPVVNYALLGSTVADGIFSWISFGVDTTKNVSARPAVSLAASITPSGAGTQVTPVAK
jgi:protocatechuate 3,4-dioxygenase beta subunit